jgi:hypothetical protein
MKFIRRIRFWLGWWILDKRDKQSLLKSIDAEMELTPVIETIVQKLGWRFIHDIYIRDLNFEYEDGSEKKHETLH